MSTRISKLNHDERRERRKSMAELVKSGKDVISVARLNGVTPRTVRDACREFLVEPPPREYSRKAS